MSKTHRIQNPRVWKLASVLILICGSPLYGQGRDPRTAALWQAKDARAAAGAKAAAGQAARATYSASALPDPKAVGAFITFDVPGAGNAAFTGSFPMAINNGGAVTGFYCDDAFLCHGFVRAANGSFATFDAPGAVFGTYTTAINNSGAVTGPYFDNVGSGEHAFVRGPDGRFITFDVPAGAFGTEPIAINSRGEVTGLYFDVNLDLHTFLRESNGALTTFDPPGAVLVSQPSMITDDGVILGVYSDATGDYHGFMRSPSGAFTEISGPGGLGGQSDSLNFFFFYPITPLSINPSGVIAGTYFEPVAGTLLEETIESSCSRRTASTQHSMRRAMRPVVSGRLPPASTPRERLSDRLTTASTSTTVLCGHETPP